MKLTAKSKPCVVNRAATKVRFLPHSRLICADIPIPIPIIRQFNPKVTGKVKLIAASACVPSIETKKVSTTLNNKIATMPNTIGKVKRGKT